MRAFYLFLCFMILPMMAQAVDTKKFKVSLDNGWNEMKAGQDDEQYFYSYGNRDSRAFVLYRVGKKKDKKFTDTLRDELIEEVAREVKSRGGDIQEASRYKSKGCTVDYLAYYKPQVQGTNVDFYMYCGGTLVTANYAVQGMDASKISLVKDLHKSFKLK